MSQYEVDDYNYDYDYNYDPDDELYHFGVKGMRWGIRRFQNEDGSPTAAGRGRYSSKKGVNWKKAAAIGAGAVGTLGLGYLAYRNKGAIVDTGKRIYNTARSRFGKGNGALVVRNMNNGAKTGFKAHSFRSRMADVRNTFANARTRMNQNGGIRGMAGRAAEGFGNSAKRMYNTARSRFGKGNGALVVRNMNNGAKTGFKRTASAFTKARKGFQNAYNRANSRAYRVGNSYYTLGAMGSIARGAARKYGKYAAGAGAVGAGAGIAYSRRRRRRRR